jgi:hypothetical protein
VRSRHRYRNIKIDIVLKCGKTRLNSELAPVETLTIRAEASLNNLLIYKSECVCVCMFKINSLTP